MVLPTLGSTANAMLLPASKETYNVLPGTTGRDFRHQVDTAVHAHGEGKLLKLVHLCKCAFESCTDRKEGRQNSAFARLIPKKKGNVTGRTPLLQGEHCLLQGDYKNDMISLLLSN